MYYIKKLGYTLIKWWIHKKYSGGRGIQKLRYSGSWRIQEYGNEGKSKNSPWEFRLSILTL